LSERGGGDAYVPIDLLPRHLIDAVVATEDRRFFKHWGLDPSGMIRAAFTNVSQGRVAQGGSTLTQQLAKNLFLGSERTWARKLEELVLALWLEARLGKRNILELYLNRVYLGAGAYGVETAAQRFFAKSARDVTLVEAAMLAGLLKAPSKYSPASNPPMARERANSVLAKMVEAGLLSAPSTPLCSAALRGWCRRR
jgi:penicillin-binding protein 1A